MNPRQAPQKPQPSLLTIREELTRKEKEDYNSTLFISPKYTIEQDRIGLEWELLGNSSHKMGMECLDMIGLEAL